MAGANSGVGGVSPSLPPPPPCGTYKTVALVSSVEQRYSWGHMVVLGVGGPHTKTDSIQNAQKMQFITHN